jgi:hypothetical protein
LILDRREADVVVETLAAVILANRPPRRRSTADPLDHEVTVDVELSGHAARPRSHLRRAGS